MKQTANTRGEFQRSLKRLSPIILTYLSAIGMIATVIMAVKATPKAMELLEKTEADKGEELTKSEVVKTAAPVYIPTVLTGIAALSCLFGASVLSKKQQAAYISAYTLLDNAYREHKDKVAELYGKGANDKVEEALIEEKCGDGYIPASGEKLVFYEEHYGDFFELTEVELLMAEYELNRTLMLKGYVTLNEFYQYLGLPTNDVGETLGWSLWAGEAFYGYAWIDFEHKKHTLDDGLEYYIISMPFPPTMDFEDY